MKTVYLITGANRGIGRGLLELIVARHDTTVVALVRDTEHSTSKSLSSCQCGTNSNIIVLPYEAKSPDSAAAAISTLQKDDGIEHLDVVIANAGFLNWRGPTVDVPADVIQEHIAVNTIGPLLLFRACLPLLQSAISSAIGSTERIPQFAQSATLPYGLSKAALNHLFRKLSIEHPDIAIELLTPGPVLTSLMRDFAGALEKMVKADSTLLNRFSPIDKVVKGLLECIDGANLSGKDGEKGTSGGFRNWTGETIPW